MKTLHVVSDIDDRFGGPSKSVPLLCVNLERIGVHAEIAYTKFLPSDRNEILDGSGIGVTAIPLTASRNLYYSRHAAATLQNIISDKRIDLVHIHSMWRHNAWSAFNVARKNGVAHVVSPRSNLYPASLERSRGKKLVMRRLFVDRMVQTAAFVHATEPDEASAVRQAGYKDVPVVTIPNGIYLAEAHQSEAGATSMSATDRNLLFLSRVHPRKGIDILIDAFPQMRAVDPAWKLWIAGPCEDDAYLRRLEAQIQRNGLSDHVKFLGMLRGAEKTDAYLRADLFVLPSYFENFGLSIGEALQSATPVVTTSATPWGRIASEAAGWIVKEGSSDDLGGALAAAARKSPSELRQMGKRGVELAAEYRWDAVATSMAEAYTKHLPRTQSGISRATP